MSRPDFKIHTAELVRLLRLYSGLGINWISQIRKILVGHISRLLIFKVSGPSLVVEVIGIPSLLRWLGLKSLGLRRSCQGLLAPLWVLRFVFGGIGREAGPALRRTDAAQITLNPCSEVVLDHRVPEFGTGVPGVVQPILGGLFQVVLFSGALYLAWKLVMLYRRQVPRTVEDFASAAVFQQETDEGEVDPAWEPLHPAGGHLVEAVRVQDTVVLRGKYWRWLVRRLKMEFNPCSALGDPKLLASTRLIVERRARHLVKKHKVRMFDVNAHLPIVLEMVFIPSQSEILAKMFAASSVVCARIERYVRQYSSLWGSWDRFVSRVLPARDPRP